MVCRGTAGFEAVALVLIDGAEGREKRVEDAAGDRCSLLCAADADMTEKRGCGAACMLKCRK